MTKNHDQEGKAVSQESHKKAGANRKGDDIGKALRSAYDKTLNEDVPDELLDLLGKLK